MPRCRAAPSLRAHPVSSPSSLRRFVAPSLSSVSILHPPSSILHSLFSTLRFVALPQCPMSRNVSFPTIQSHVMAREFTNQSHRHIPKPPPRATNAVSPRPHPKIKPTDQANQTHAAVPFRLDFPTSS